MTTAIEQRRSPSTTATLRWAVETAWTDSRNRGRLIATAIGVGFCFLVLLMVVTIPAALDSMEERRSAMSPSSLGDGSPSFGFLGSAIDLGGGRVINGYWVDGAPSAPVPPGITTFPVHGQLWVSPELYELLLADSSTGVILPGEVVGIIDQDVLPNPYDLVFYGGTALTDTQQSLAADSWGGSIGGLIWSEFDPGYWSILVTGTSVLLIPLFLVVALASRFGAARRDRRSALLRLLGARHSQLRFLVVAEAAVASAAGLVLGGGLFLVVRALGPQVHIGSFGLQSWDLTPPLFPALLVAGAVFGISVTVALIGARQAAVGPLGVLNSASRRPRAMWRILLVTLTGGVGVFLLNDRPSDLYPSLTAPDLIIRSGLIITLGLVSIACLVGLLSDFGARSSRPRSPAAQLAARRITADGSVTTRAAAAMATVLAGALILVGVFEDTTHRPSDGFLTLHGAAEIQRMESELQTILGSDLEHLSLGTTVGRSTPGGPYVESTTCGQLVRDHPGTPCLDGDVFRIAPPGQVPSDTPMELSFFDGSKTVTDTWSPPADVIDLTDSGFVLGDVYYLLTPGALESIHPDSLNVVRAQASFSADEATRQRLIDEMPWLGQRVGGLLERNFQLVFGVDVLPWLKFGILLAGALTLLAAGFAQILTANEQLTERRRAYALARATGVPLSTLRRSVVLGALWPAIVGVVVAVLSAAVLAPVLQAARFREALPIDVGWALGGAAVVLLSTVVIALISAARLDKLTGPDALRTE